VKCGEILLKIVEIARHHVRTGRTTERRLAREAGLSQPHLHNLLKGIRRLSPESADQILEALNLRFSDIIWWLPGDPEPGTRVIPMVRDRIGPGSLANLSILRGYIGLPRTFADRLVNPLAVRLASDPGMPSPLRPNDTVVLDRNPELLVNPPDGSYWVVAEAGGLRVRYLKLSDAELMSGSEPEDGKHPVWKFLSAGRPAAELVRGRIVWISRELEAPPPRPSGAPRDGD